MGARPHARQEEVKARLDKEVAARPAIHPARHQDAQVLQGRRISGLHPRYTTGTDRSDEGLFDEFVGIAVLL